LIDIQRGLLYFVDKHGSLSEEEAQWFEEEEGEGAEGSDSYGSTSFENTPSLHSVPSLERSASGSSSIIYASAESSDGIEEVTPTRARSNVTADDEITRLAPPKPKSVPGASGAIGPSESAGQAAVRPGFVPGKPRGLGAPPPPDGRFFNNPLNLRTIMTGAGDGYRSPEPQSRRDALSPPRHCPTMNGLNPSGTAAEQSQPPFSVPQPVVTQPPNDPVGRWMEHGYGLPPPPSSSLVLPVELMAYNDLMVDIGTAQYLGAGMRPPFAHPPMPANGGRGANDFSSNVNGHQREDFPQRVAHEPPQVVPPFWHPQQDRPHRGVDYASAQQTHAGHEGQWPVSGTVDYG